MTCFFEQLNANEFEIEDGNQYERQAYRQVDLGRLEVSIEEERQLLADQFGGSHPTITA